MSKLMKMLPEQMTGGMQMTDEQSELVDHQMKRTEAIIGSMTKQERNDHKVIDASRKTRIAGGSGSTISEINQLLRQYEQMRKMMVQMNRGGMFGKMARGMAGGLAGGLGGLLGGGGGNPLGMLGSGSAIDYSNDEPNGGSSTTNLRKKKRHKKRR
jgi:signal recognition particle subunit SRP54